MDVDTLAGQHRSVCISHNLNWNGTHRAHSSLMSPILNSQDLDFYFYLHQTAHTHKYKPTRHDRFHFIKINELFSLKSTKMLKSQYHSLPPNVLVICSYSQTNRGNKTLLTISCDIFIHCFLLNTCFVPSYRSILQLVKPWYDEVKDYSFPYPRDCNPRCPLRCYGPMCTHYTQVRRQQSVLSAVNTGELVQQGY